MSTLPTKAEDTAIDADGMRGLVEAVAKAIHESTFDESYDGLSECGIDKAFARQHAIAALNAVADFGDARFPVHPGLSDEAKARRSAALDELGALDGELL